MGGSSSSFGGAGTSCLLPAGLPSLPDVNRGILPYLATGWSVLLVDWLKGVYRHLEAWMPGVVTTYRSGKTVISQPAAGGPPAAG